ncbi:Uma2 family endonuclease [Alkalinema sp. FACHB-956]|uniref:Uma2 family endonuclease n=1 Tax=Alkalinema sp. FACHB-956 TaxID=2692768 RepID=UPI001688893B|nr:Uma2 family endonuclease [Alkalinema sp. FACHB-956]MBD2327474.1 Uma2 family endonuclease [Alkalinema sp. FACHB-956]
MVVTINLRPTLELTDEQFEQICHHNRDLKFERTARGGLVIMSLTGGDTGERNAELTGQLWLWNRQARLGHLYDSSTGFRLPNGAIRSPDAAWISQTRWDALTPEQRQKWVPLCPDFVVELKSPSDEIEDLRLKMQEYLDNGSQLGWLIDPDTQTVEIYQANSPIAVLSQPTELSAPDLMPGFVLNLMGIL